MADTDRKEKVKEALERIDQGIESFFQSDHFKEYLAVMGRFHHYSARNCVLIASQLQARGQEFTGRVAGYNDWKKNFNRQVKKGEHGIMILAPIKRTIEVEVAGKYDLDGNPVKEKKDYMTFRPAYVFHEVQTEGDPLPELVKRLDFEVDGYEILKDALIKVAECPVVFEDFNDSSINGYFNPVKNEIHIREGMSQAQTIKTFLHEMAHKVLHPESLSDKTRQEKELEAEASAYIVASTYLSIDTGSYTFPYLGSWSEGKSLKEMTECIENIKRGSDILINKLDRILCLEMTKEEAEAEKKEEEVCKKMEEAGVEAENVSIVADRPGTFVLAAVRNGEDEKKVLQQNGSFSFAGESLSFSTLNMSLDNEPTYEAQLSEYGRGEYDASWPMVQIRYTNVPGIIRSEMNIYEFQKMVACLPQEVLDDRGKYFKVCLSYTYNDRNYQRVLDIDLGNGRVDYLNYLPIEGGHIAHLKSHVILLQACDEARRLAPNVEQGIAFEDSMQEWAGVCREMLNHNSDHPVIPKPPSITEDVGKERYVERSMEL